MKPRHALILVCSLAPAVSGAQPLTAPGSPLFCTAQGAAGEGREDLCARAERIAGSRPCTDPSECPALEDWTVLMGRPETLLIVVEGDGGSSVVELEDPSADVDPEERLPDWLLDESEETRRFTILKGKVDWGRPSFLTPLPDRGNDPGAKPQE